MACIGPVVRYAHDLTHYFKHTRIAREQHWKQNHCCRRLSFVEIETKAILWFLVSEEEIYLLLEDPERLLTEQVLAFPPRYSFFDKKVSRSRVKQLMNCFKSKIVSITAWIFELFCLEIRIKLEKHYSAFLLPSEFLTIPQAHAILIKNGVCGSSSSSFSWLTHYFVFMYWDTFLSKIMYLCQQKFKSFNMWRLLI